MFRGIGRCGRDGDNFFQGEGKENERKRGREIRGRGRAGKL